MTLQAPPMHPTPKMGDQQWIDDGVRCRTWEWTGDHWILIKEETSSGWKRSGFEADRAP